MSSKRVGKIASEAIKNREQTPIMSWIRDRLLGVSRSSKTDPPGLAHPDGKCHYANPVRFPNTQSARDSDTPDLPGGINHRLTDVYYYDRDDRRHVKPPTELYKVGKDGQLFLDLEGKTLSDEDLNKEILKGPSENFGINGPPTPGTGFEWKRNISLERDTQKNDPHLKRLERFDRYAKH